MVKISKVYTRVGDQGSTHLGDGSAVDKSSVRVGAYGLVDEANSMLGYVVASMPESDQGQTKEIREALLSIQNDLFDVGADLCVPIDATEKPGARLRVQSKQSDRIETMIDRFNEPLSELDSFVLPGGTLMAANLHVARTIVRRAERAVAMLFNADCKQTNQETLVYMNRLSDLLFVLARVANDNGAKDVLWNPGASLDDDNMQTDNETAS